MAVDDVFTGALFGFLLGLGMLGLPFLLIWDRRRYDRQLDERGVRTTARVVRVEGYVQGYASGKDVRLEFVDGTGTVRQVKREIGWAADEKGTPRAVRREERVGDGVEIVYDPENWKRMRRADPDANPSGCMLKGFYIFSVLFGLFVIFITVLAITRNV